MVNLVSIAAVGAAGTAMIGTLLYKVRQYQLKNAPWFKESCEKISKHEGVRVLIGPPPIEVGDIQRCYAHEYVPLKDIEPEPYYVLKIPLKGSKGKGNLLLWMNFLKSKEEARKSVNAWNVGLMEVQMGKNESNKFIIE